MCKTPLLAAALTVSAFMLASCSSLPLGNPNAMQSPDVTSVNPKTGEVETRTSTQEIQAGILKAFPDIPVPATHKIDLNRSMIFTSASQTVGKLTTEGAGDVASVYTFYLTQMQAGGWSLVNSFQSATSNLYFTKPGRFVAIIVEPTGRASSRAIINIGPE